MNKPKSNANSPAAISFSAHAKCILAGEHAVIRGFPAVVLPIQRLQITLHYTPSNKPLTADFVGDYGESMLLMFWGTLKKALEYIQHDLDELHGELIIDNRIPICAGLGFSAALCIAIGRLFINKNWLEEKDLFFFARRLEDQFHQESSGVDIAGAIASQSVIYKRDTLPHNIPMHWRPKLYLSYSEEISITAEAVKKVKHYFETDHNKAKTLDLQMADSAETAKRALCSDEKEGLPLLINAMNKANACFKSWDLISDRLQQHMNNLTQHGALATKPTGAGAGGYVVSLWDKNPPSLDFPMYSVFDE